MPISFLLQVKCYPNYIKKIHYMKNSKQQYLTCDYIHNNGIKAFKTNYRAAARRFFHFS